MIEEEAEGAEDKHGRRVTPTKDLKLTEQIRQVIKEHGRLPVDVEVLADDADLYQAGMSSHASVNVMIALEDSFDVEFPDSMLKREVFESVAAIGRALDELRATV